MAKKSDLEQRREGALDRALSQIERQYGKGAVMRLGEEFHVQCPVIPTGSMSLDIATGVGGLPRGRMVEIFGPESSGKTTLALQAAGNAQRAGGTAAFIDAEHALDPAYARRLGVNLEELLVSQPDCGEQALEICELLVRSNAVDIVVVDSVAALVPRSEIEGEMGDAQVGVQARLMSQAMRKLTAIISKTQCCVVFINQIRMKIGVMFGNPETTTGGRALKFYTSMRLDVRRVGSLKDGEEVVGNRTRVKVVKNKVAPPFRVAEFDILYNRGISYEGDLIDLGLQHELVEKAGAWFSLGQTRLGQGRENARAFLCENRDLRDELAGRIRELSDLPAPPATEAPAEASAGAQAE
jgi:recombination protein RecA